MEKTVAITKKYIQKIYKPIEADAHKGRLGHAMIIGGSYGKIGSVCLSSKAALKSGCGLVTCFIPKCGYGILQSVNPEVMVITDETDKKISRISFDIQPKAIGIGPGLGKKKATAKALHKFLKGNTHRLVIDADALNILADNKDWFSLLSAQTILTPHAKELERLIGSFVSEEERLEEVIKIAKEFDLIFVMKGAPTYIISSDRVYKNTTGNQALATAGSGDVLTGIITGLLARSFMPVEAACLGVYLHGLTADLAVSNTGFESFIASDILSHLGEAFIALR